MWIDGLSAKNPKPFVELSLGVADTPQRLAFVLCSAFLALLVLLLLVLHLDLLLAALDSVAVALLGLVVKINLRYKFAFTQIVKIPA